MSWNVFIRLTTERLNWRADEQVSCFWVAAILDGSIEPPILSGSFSMGNTSSPRLQIRAHVLEYMRKTYGSEDVWWVNEDATPLHVHGRMTQHLRKLWKWLPSHTPDLHYTARRVTLQHLLDKYGPCCHWCGAWMRVGGCGPRQATIEHMIPKSKGGTDVIENLRASCFQCNQDRGNEMGPPPYLLADAAHEASAGSR